MDLQDVTSFFIFRTELAKFTVQYRDMGMKMRLICYYPGRNYVSVNEIFVQLFGTTVNLFRLSTSKYVIYSDIFNKIKLNAANEILG